MPTPTDEKLAGMIEDLTGNFARFQIEYATQRGETKGDLREFGAQIKGDIRELEARIKGDIRELRAQLDGTVQKLDAKFETEFRSLEKRVDRGFAFQKWLAGFLIPVTIGLIGTAISLAFSAGHLDSSVRQLSNRMDKLEQALEKISSAPLQPARSPTLQPIPPPISPPAAGPPERIFELRPVERMMGRIDGVIADGDGLEPERDVTFHIDGTLDAGKKPGWLTDGMAGLVILDGRLTSDGMIRGFSSGANYDSIATTIIITNTIAVSNRVRYFMDFRVKRPELERFRGRILAIDPAGNLPFSICFVRP